MCFTSCLLSFIFIAAWHCRVTACSEKSSLEIPWLLLVVCVLAQWLSDVWGVWNGSCSEHIQAPTVSADWSTVKDQIAICWPWCYTALSLSISYNTNCQMSRTFMNSHSSSHLEGTSKETRGGGGLHHAEYSLYANTQLTKTKQVSVTCISKESAIKITVSNIHWLLWWWSHWLKAV